MAEIVITREMELPEILSRYPACRKVFERYGLAGCGGPLDPKETLGFFARAHRVDEVCLLAELNDAASTEALQLGTPEYMSGPGDVIYRRFFRAGILTMFTFGCVLGGINLAIMATRQQLASLDMRAITWAHAHAQIAGWVTFFVMGFAYQSIPRFKFTTLWRPLLASRTLFVMAAALTLRTLADIWNGNPAWTLAGEIGGATELAVVLTFAAIITQTIRESQKPAEPYEKFIFGALAWMVAAFSFDWWIFAASAKLSGSNEWVQFISLYDAPWRDLQLAGFAGGMILGISQRFLPFIYGFREIPPRTARVVLYLWNLGVAGNAVSYAMLIRTMRPVWAITLELSILGLFASLVLLVRGFGLFSVKVERDRSLSFLRASYFWALVAIAMLALMPVYDAVLGLTFSHAYFGGYPNLARNMILTASDQLWRADITYIRLRDEFVFLAVILDAYSRRVIGWALDRTMEDELPLAALRMALSQRCVEPGLVHHSARGSQYASTDYTDLLKANHVEISMSRKGNPWDNAACESFMKTLKYEEVLRNEYRDLAEARASIRQFMEKIYNQKRLHSALGYLPPAEFERSVQAKNKDAAARQLPL